VLPGVPAAIRHEGRKVSEELLLLRLGGLLGALLSSSLLLCHSFFLILDRCWVRGQRLKRHPDDSPHAYPGVARLTGDASTELRRYAERNLAGSSRLEGRAGIVIAIERMTDDFAEGGEPGPMLKGDRIRVELRGKRHGDQAFARGFGSVRHVAVNSGLRCRHFARLRKRNFRSRRRAPFRLRETPCAQIVNADSLHRV